MRSTLKLALAGLAAAATLALPSTAAAGDHHGGGGHGDDHGDVRRCAQQFEVAQKQDMETFRDFDAAGWRAVHDENAISIAANGVPIVGIDAIMAATESYFEAKNVVWSWTELRRSVNGCESGFIIYNTTYAIPSQNFSVDLLTVVSYVHKGNKWLGVLDQNTVRS